MENEEFEALKRHLQDQQDQIAALMVAVAELLKDRTLTRNRLLDQARDYSDLVLFSTTPDVNAAAVRSWLGRLAGRAPE